MQLIRAAIFDFDELMIDIESIHFQAATVLARECGITDPAEIGRRIPKVSGRRISDWLADLVTAFQLPYEPRALLARREQIMLELLQRSPLALMPGAADAVHMLHDAGLRLAVTSSGFRSYIEVLLNRFGLAPLFETVVTGADVMRGKPDPEPYLVTARRLGLRPAECVVFEDAAIGVRAAKAAGMMCVGVPNPAAEQTQDLSPADLILPSLSDLRLNLLEWDARTDKGST
ncbi:MAG: HAD family hydrolase [Symbiobacteriia bacterium]